MEIREDRLKVRTVLNKNMVVEAGAGTGKTTLLIDRLCLMILIRGIKIEKIVALTFTEKAAAEIKTRLVLALEEIIKDYSSNMEDEGKKDNLALQEKKSEEKLSVFIKKHFVIEKDSIITRAREALAKLDRAAIGTIHSFCAEILKTFPLEAGLSPKAEIDSGIKSSEIFEVEWSAFLDKELGEAAPREKLWEEVLEYVSLDALKEFTQLLCSGKIEKYDYFSHNEFLDSICAQKQNKAQELLNAFYDGKKKRSIDVYLEYAVQSLKRTRQFLMKKEVPPIMELDTPLPKSFPQKVLKGWTEETFLEAKEIVDFAEKITPEKQAIFLKILDIVSPVIDKVKSIYQREGILSFHDLLIKTRNLLRKDLYVRRVLKGQYDVLFIDEFQDTDPVQGELLLFLAEDKSKFSSSWKDVQLEQGKLSVVGDPKQSIYRFRGADITAYELFTDLILKQNGDKCFLQTNYRSASGIVSLANCVCETAMKYKRSFQPEYVPILPQKRLPQDNSVEWLFINDKEDSHADEYRHNQAERIAQWIENNVGTLRVNKGQKLTYKDITVLSRAGTNLKPYTDALRRHGIPFVSDSDKDFFKKQEINDLINLLQLIINPMDKIALVGVLRSPWGGFTDEEIYELSKEKQLNVFSQTVPVQVKEIYDAIRNLQKKAGKLTVKDFLEELFNSIFFTESCIMAYEGEKTLEILQKVALSTLNSNEQNTQSLVNFVSSLKEQVNDAELQLNTNSVSTTDSVSVMTIHRSKGLGFPIVILADLTKEEKNNDSNLAEHVFSWQYEMDGLKIGSIIDANLAFLQAEQKEHERCEEVRILYVALTRAKEHLVLVGDARKQSKKYTNAFLNAGVFPVEKAEIISSKDCYLQVHRYDCLPANSFIYQYVSEQRKSIDMPDFDGWYEVHQSRLEKYTNLISNTNKSPSHIQTDSVISKEAVLVGNACHKVLELLFKNRSLFIEQAVEKAVDLCQAQPVSVQVKNIMYPFCASATFEHLRKCEVLGVEMPFSVRLDDGTVQSGIIDVLLRKPNGQLWVLDYKTSHVLAGQEKEWGEKYRSQLEIYRKVVEDMFEIKDVISSVVFLRTFAVQDL